jgi:hypothetical protein
MPIKPILSLSVQQPLDIRQTASLHFIAFALLLSERQAHQRSLVLLDVENIVIGSTLNYETEDAAVLLLTESVNTINSLVFHGWRRPNVREDDLIYASEIQADSANTKESQHDSGIVVILKSTKRLIATVGRHGPVDATELVAFLLQTCLDDVRETSPLAKDNGLVLLRPDRGKNSRHRFDLAA